MAEENDSFLDELNEECFDCQDNEGTTIVPCTTTTFVADSPVAVTATVGVSGESEYDVCCEPVGIKPLNYSICSKGVVFFKNITVITAPTKGKLYIGTEEVSASDVLTKQEMGLLVYKRTIDAEAEDGIQVEGTDTIELRVDTTGGNSSNFTITFNLQEATCKEESPCSFGCGE